MDPLSVSTSCIGLITAIAKTSVAVTNFVREVRDARRDLDAVSRELSSLTTVLELLADDASDNESYIPSTLQTQITGILSNCNGVVIEIQNSMSKHESSKLGKAGYWTVGGGKGDMSKLRSTLEAHKTALEIALEMLAITITRDIKKETTAILNDTTAIKGDTTRILEEIARLQSQLPAGSTAGRSNEMLQRYLDSLTSYAGTVYDDSTDDELDYHQPLHTILVNRTTEEAVSASSFAPPGDTTKATATQSFVYPPVESDFLPTLPSNIVVYPSDYGRHESRENRGSQTILRPQEMQREDVTAEFWPDSSPPDPNPSFHVEKPLIRPLSAPPATRELPDFPTPLSSFDSDYRAGSDPYPTVTELPLPDSSRSDFPHELYDLPAEIHDHQEQREIATHSAYHLEETQIHEQKATKGHYAIELAVHAKMSKMIGRRAPRERAYYRFTAFKRLPSDSSNAAYRLRQDQSRIHRAEVLIVVRDDYPIRSPWDLSTTLRSIVQNFRNMDAGHSTKFVVCVVGKYGGVASRRELLHHLMGLRYSGKNGLKKTFAERLLNKGRIYPISPDLGTLDAAGYSSGVYIPSSVDPKRLKHFGTIASLYEYTSICTHFEAYKDIPSGNGFPMKLLILEHDLGDSYTTILHDIARLLEVRTCMHINCGRSFNKGDLEQHYQEFLGPQGPPVDAFQYLGLTAKLYPRDAEILRLEAEQRLAYAQAVAAGITLAQSS